MVWADLCREIAVEIHGDERDFTEEPLNDGEWMTVRLRAEPLFASRLNRAQRRGIGHRSPRLPETMSAKIGQR